MADDATAMDEQQEEDGEEDEEEVEGEGGEEDGEEEDEGEGEDDDDELKKDVTPTPTPPSLVDEMQQDAGPADHSCPISSTPPIPSAPGPPAVCKELQQVEVELRLLEALEIYHPSKLLGMHRHFILYGLMEYLERRLNHHFTSEEILELLDRFYNLELLKPDEEEFELLSQEEEFSLPASILAVKEEPRGSS